MLPPGLSLQEEREACRALKGLMLRQEVYALDGTEKQAHPYTVVEQNFTITPLQLKRGANRNAVFFTHPCEALRYRYERNPADPRIEHALTLEVDEFGDVLKSAAIAYARRLPDNGLTEGERACQSEPLVTYGETDFTNEIAQPDDYRTPALADSRTYELVGYPATGPAGRFQSADLVQPDPSNPTRLLHLFDTELRYEDRGGDGRRRRPIQHVRTLYRCNDLTDLLPTGALESLAVTGETYKLAFTPGLLAQVFQRGGETLLPAGSAAVLGGGGGEGGGYADLDGDGSWWVPSGRIFLSGGAADSAADELACARRRFFLPHRYCDAFGESTCVAYDGHLLLAVETRDPLGNCVTAGERRPNGALDPARPGNDYRVLQPRLMMDANRNRSEVAFDALGMVVGTAVMGKPEENLGDSLEGFEADLTDAAVRDHVADPLTAPLAILGAASTRLVYDIFAYRRTKDQPRPQPATVYTLARETHHADLAAGATAGTQHGFSYSDGLGREIQLKRQAAAWIGSGWTVFNNKGKPVRQYEPFFTDTHRFEFDVKIGVSPVLFYYPAGRLAGTLHPNRTWEKTVFNPWRQEIWDVSDTVLVADPKTDADVGGYFRRLSGADYLPTWYAERQDGALGEAGQDAATKAAMHAATPSVVYADPLGRSFLSVAHNRFTRDDNRQVDEFYRTRAVFDIEGNQRGAIDSRNRVAMRYGHDMLGNLVHQASMEAGERWMLNDAGGKPLYAWNSRGHRFRTAYDALRRPADVLLREGGDPEIVIGRSV